MKGEHLSSSSLSSARFVLFLMNKVGKRNIAEILFESSLGLQFCSFLCLQYAFIFCRWQLSAPCVIPSGWRKSPCPCWYYCHCCCCAMELETSAQRFMTTAGICRYCSISSRASATHLEPWAIGPKTPTSVGGLVSRAPWRDDHCASCRSLSEAKI